MANGGTITGTVTLSGSATDVFIFQSGSGALNTATSSHVVLTGGVKAYNVFWAIGGTVGTGALSSFAGTLLSQGAITLGAGASLDGRALSRGAGTLSTPWWVWP